MRPCLTSALMSVPCKTALCATVTVTHALRGEGWGGLELLAPGPSVQRKVPKYKQDIFDCIKNINKRRDNRIVRKKKNCPYFNGCSVFCTITINTELICVPGYVSAISINIPLWYTRWRPKSPKKVCEIEKENRFS